MKVRHKKYYKQLADAATSVILSNNGTGMQYRSGNPAYVEVAFSPDVEFADGFPKGHLLRMEGDVRIHKVNAVKLLDWLYEKGYSSYNVRGLMRTTKAYEVLNNKLEALIKGESE